MSSAQERLKALQKLRKESIQLNKKALTKDDLERQGVDVERLRNLQYTVLDVERWEEKQAEKAARRDNGFTDYQQKSHKKYEKMVSQIKPNLKEREQRANFSKRKFKKDDTVDYINDRNKRFNKKVARAFDAHTKEIKDNLERGTAL
ncbi:SYF2 splicing factor-domain-containing protein [Gorgonomyces haynaldii]|nr:SYF2 splicing factor-domain-containing protein [Gorgonomyces haynaldii]